MINHDEISPAETVCPTSSVVSPTQQISTITITTNLQVSTTITTTIQVSATTTTTMLVSTTRMTQSSSDTDDAVTICVPIVVVFGVIILVVVVIIGTLIWRKMKSRSDGHLYNKPIPRATNALVENDLYGLVY